MLAATQRTSCSPEIAMSATLPQWICWLSWVTTGSQPYTWGYAANTVTLLAPVQEQGVIYSVNSQQTSLPLPPLSLHPSFPFYNLIPVTEAIPPTFLPLSYPQRVLRSTKDGFSLRMKPNASNSIRFRCSFRHQGESLKVPKLCCSVKTCACQEELFWVELYRRHGTGVTFEVCDHFARTEVPYLKTTMSWHHHDITSKLTSCHALVACSMPYILWYFTIKELLDNQCLHITTRTISHKE